MQNTSIKHWAEDDRVTKTVLKGNSTLSNAELIAILINNGNKRQKRRRCCKTIASAVGK